MLYVKSFLYVQRRDFPFSGEWPFYHMIYSIKWQPLLQKATHPLKPNKQIFFFLLIKNSLLIYIFPLSVYNPLYKQF